MKPNTLRLPLQELARRLDLCRHILRHGTAPPADNASKPQPIYTVTVVAQLYQVPRRKADLTLADRLRRSFCRWLRKPIAALRLQGAPSIDTRAVGIFNTLERACQAVLRDEGGLSMCRYDYAVIETLGEGIHPFETDRQRWFHYRDGTWLPCDAPAFSHGVVNFSIG